MTDSPVLPEKMEEWIAEHIIRSIVTPTLPLAGVGCSEGSAVTSEVAGRRIPLSVAGDPADWDQSWIYIGRGQRRRGLAPSTWGNPFKVSDVGRQEAVASYRRMLLSDSQLRARLTELRGCVLVCHCEAEEACHGDVILELLEAELEKAGVDINEDDGNEGPKYKSGEGPRGAGPPLHTWKRGLPRELADGGAWCSPGKWPIGRRPEAVE